MANDPSINSIEFTKGDKRGISEFTKPCIAIAINRYRTLLFFWNPFQIMIVKLTCKIIAKTLSNIANPNCEIGT